MTTRHAPFLVEVDDVAGHVLLLFQIHARHRLVEQNEPRLERHGAGQLDPLAQPVREGPGSRFADVLDIEEIDDLFHLAAVLQLFAAGAGEPVDRTGEKVALQEVVAPDHDVVEHAHVSEQREALERAADADRGATARRQVRDVTPVEQHAAAESASNGPRCSSAARSCPHRSGR